MSKKLLFRLAVLVVAMMCAQGASAQEAYACADYNYTSNYATLTFYYDNDRSSRLGATFELNAGYDLPYWVTSGFNNDVKYVVFDPSFAAARPTSTRLWFGGMYNLESITGLSYLNTSEVTNMVWMFSGCYSLTSLDLSSFNTSKVTSMESMFDNCASLTSLDLSSFNTSQVNSMEYMFHDCRELTSVDLSSFNTSQVTDMEYMFANCWRLRAIYVGSGWTTASVIESSGMFFDCTSLVGGQGTTYDYAHIDAAYAQIDGGPSNPGYFSEKPAYLRGDVNGDGGVNIVDVTDLIDYLLSGSASGINLSAADCNQDGSINIGDVTTLIDYLLSGSW